MFKSIIAAMESVPRCILLYCPGRGWAATDVEGEHFDNLIWSNRADTAVHKMTGINISISSSEAVIMDHVVANGERWAAEWYPRDGWLRPLTVDASPVA